MTEVAKGHVDGRVAIRCQVVEGHSEVGKAVLHVDPANSLHEDSWHDRRKSCGDLQLSHCLGVNFDESGKEEHHSKAGVEAVPKATGEVSPHLRHVLRCAFRLRPVHEAQHDVVLEPVVHVDVPAG